jgi:hypothetical protein
MRCCITASCSGILKTILPVRSGTRLKGGKRVALCDPSLYLQSASRCVEYGERSCSSERLNDNSRILNNTRYPMKIV